LYLYTNKYSRYAEPTTGKQLESVLDVKTGCRVAVLHVADDDEATIAAFRTLHGFEVLTDEEYAERMTVTAEWVPDQPETGDPLTDAGAHSYYREELQSLPLRDLKTIAARVGVEILPGATKNLAIENILDAQGQSVNVLAGAPPAPPSSED
jgi:hypothetical protein